VAAAVLGLYWPVFSAGAFVLVGRDFRPKAEFAAAALRRHLESSMRILVTFAVEAEFSPWRRRHNFESQRVEVVQTSKSLLSYQADLDGITVDVLLTGMGWEDSLPNPARDGLRVLFGANPEFCVSTGLAGGLKPEWHPGDVVAATEIGSYQGEAKIRSNRYALEVAKKCGAKVAHKLMTWNHIVSETSAKQAMGVFSDLVDMESYFILTMAGGAEVPAIAVRGVADSSDEELPIDFSKVTDREGRLVVKHLVRALASKPRRIPSLLSFAQRSRKAISNLADFLDDFIPSLARDQGKIRASAFGEVAVR